MSEQVKVADVETIERFRAQLIQAAETFGLALEEAEGDVEREEGVLAGLGLFLGVARNRGLDARVRREADEQQHDKR